MNAIARSIRARGEAISLETASGDVEVRGIVGRGGDVETAGDAASLATPAVGITLAAEDAAAIDENAIAEVAGLRYRVRGVVDQGLTKRVVLQGVPEAAA